MEKRVHPLSGQIIDIPDTSSSPRSERGGSSRKRPLQDSGFLSKEKTVIETVGEVSKEEGEIRDVFVCRRRRKGEIEMSSQLA